MLRLDGDDARCIRNRGIATENAEAEAIARNAVRGKSGGGDLLSRRRAVSQKRAMSELRDFVDAPAKARKARGLDPRPPVTAPVRRPTESSRARAQAPQAPATIQNASTVPANSQSAYRATDTRALDEYSDAGLRYDAGTGRRVRPSAVTYDELKDLVEADERRLSPQDSSTGIEWVDNKGGEIRPYVSGENRDFAPEIRDYLETPNFHSGMRHVKRKLETAVAAPRQVPPEIVKPEVFASEGETVKRPPPPPKKKDEKKDDKKDEKKDDKKDEKKDDKKDEKKDDKKDVKTDEVPAVLSAKKIVFKRTTDLTGKTVEFDGTEWLGEINHVAGILRRNPTVRVEIKAFVGVTSAAVALGLELAGNTPAVLARYGRLMDARAKKVRDLLVVQGIDPARIDLARGESGVGDAFLKVDFRFIVP